MNRRFNDNILLIDNIIVDITYAREVFYIDKYGQLQYRGCSPVDILSPQVDLASKDWLCRIPILNSIITKFYQRKNKNRYKR